MNRRLFLRNSIAGSLALLSTPPFNCLTLGGEAPASVDLRSLLEAEDPQVMRLVQDIFRECVLGKLRPPEGTLKRRWITAGGGFYGQWIWDTMFVVDLLSILPGMEQNIREIFQNYWDFQARWNAQMPAYAHDMVACMIEPKNNDWVKYPAYSQIPILAWGMERVYQRNGDKTLLQQGLAPLERFHEWYWRERDVTQVGLIAVGSYSGNIQHGRFETFDYECNLDGLNDKTIANAMKNGISEHYDAVSGKPLGVTFLGMSCTIATLMLDGLSGKYRARVKKASL